MGAFVRADGLVNRVSTGSKHLLGGLLSRALTPDEMSELSVWLYDRLPGRYETKGLWTWERDWFRSRLPPPPARILVGAAGSGREAIALAELGYQVDAFDPATRMVELAEAVLAAPHQVRVGSFEDLSSAVLDLADNQLSVFAGNSYDAVLLGWGALSHVIEGTERERLLAASTALAPDGPVLASFFLRVEATRGGRTRRLGAQLGQRIAGARGLQSEASQIEFSTSLGFTQVFAAEELERLASSCDRELVWDPEPGFPHATFAVPR